MVNWIFSDAPRTAELSADSDGNVGEGLLDETLLGSNKQTSKNAPDEYAADGERDVMMVWFYVGMFYYLCSQSTTLVARNLWFSNISHQTAGEVWCLQRNANNVYNQLLDQGWLTWR